MISIEFAQVMNHESIPMSPKPNSNRIHIPGLPPP